MASKKTDRRQQVRQQRTERTISLWRKLRDSVGVTPVLMGITFFVAACAIALYGAQSHNYTIGQKIDQPITADVDFSVADEQETLRRKQAAREGAPSHYRLNVELIARVATDLQNLYQAAQAAESFEAFKQSAESSAEAVDDAAYQELRSYADEATRARYEKSIARLRSNLRTEYTWRRASAAQRTPASTADFIVLHDEEAGPGHESPREIRVFNLTPISNVTSLQRGASDVAYSSGFAGPIRPAVTGIVLKHMSESPTLLFDLALTNDAMAKEEAAVGPATLDFKRGEPIIPARPEQGLTAADLQLLSLHDAACQSFLASDDLNAKALRDKRFREQAGLATIFALTTAALFCYVSMYQRRILEMRSRIVALVALLLGTLLAARVIDARTSIEELVYVPPLFAGSVLAVAYTRRFAVGVMAVVGVMIVLCIGGDTSALVTLVVGVASTVYLLKEIRTRTRLLWVGALAASTMFLAATAFGLFNGQAIEFAVRRGGWAALGALLSAMLVQAALPLIERVFRFATSLTLLEWRDPTRPLLQLLAREAPGTYNHSLVLGTLAEAAAEAIGANGLLAQVGALYHDIGKIHKAEYFTENQGASINRHDKLSPTMSLLIIVGHVKDGIEMAREYKLPRVLHQFIAEHHGTTVVRYFHHIASEKQFQISSGRHDRNVPESRFRYPGPKPKTKESAILMLCDGVEGAVRSLGEPTPGRIEQVVHQIFTHRLNDGQFDDCDISLRELHRVEESLVKSLSSYYHGRVAYPKPAKETPHGPPGHEARESVAG